MITRPFLRWTAVALIVAVAGTPALGAPTVISELGTSPLLGPTPTLAELQVSVARNERRLAVAAGLVGMSDAEYRAFRVAIQTEKPRWGRVPRRLSAMTWFDGSSVRVIRDVEIPAATYGLEFDEESASERLRIFLPVSCGNLSILRERLRRAAAMPPRSAVAASAMAPPARPAQLPAETAMAPAPQPTPAAVPTTLPTITLGSRPPRGFWPFLATFFGFIVIGGGSHGTGGGGGGGKPPCGCGVH